MAYVKTNYSGIVQDTKTKVFINTDDSDYNKILQQRNQEKQFQHLHQQIDSLRTEFEGLREMLKQVLSGKT